MFTKFYVPRIQYKISCKMNVLLHHNLAFMISEQAVLSGCDWTLVGQISQNSRKYLYSTPYHSGIKNGKK